jgi:hypothetical protein
MEFDTCYHEHISFFNTRSMTHLANRCGLMLLKTFLVRIHGDSPVYILTKGESTTLKNSLETAFSSGAFAIKEHLESYEDSISLYSDHTYENFKIATDQLIDDFRSITKSHRDNGFKIVFIGAAAKAMTVINSAKIMPDEFLDESHLKIGRVPPGLGIRIKPLEYCCRIEEKCLFVITAWNFKSELVQKIRELGVPSGSRVYSYFPKPSLESL